MTLEELNEAKAAAISREDLLKTIANVRQAGFADGFRRASDREVPPLRAFGVSLDERAVEDLRKTLIVTLNTRVAAIDLRLRNLGVVFPEPIVMPRPPVSWDPATREFTFTISSTEPVRGSRRILPMGSIDVDEVLSGDGFTSGAKLPPINFETQRGTVRIGDVVRVWTEDGMILGRGRLLEEASNACAAVASGAVRDVHAYYDAFHESVVQREGQRPLVTLERWNLLDVALIAADAEGIGVLDPRDECPGKAEAA